MEIPPTLGTARLRLRSYSDADIAELVLLIGTRDVAATTLRIAHPYTEQDARDFLAITLRGDGRQIGSIGLRVNDQHQHGELGYWLGVRCGGQGYATEAAREMLRYGFADLGLHRTFASRFKHTPVSGRILLRLGMRHEGCQGEHLRKWDQFVDSELYGILRQEWQISGKDRE